MTRHVFDHFMCGDCWIAERASRMPYSEGFPESVTCCWCGRLTSSGIVHWSVWAPQCEENPR